MKKLFFTLTALLILQIGHSQNVTVAGALTGNGSYPDMNSAFVAINSGAQTAANISVSIVGNTTESVTASLANGAWASISIQPSGGSLRTVAGNLAAPLVDLNGADNVYINGLNSGGDALILSNNNAGGSTLRLTNDANSNMISNCTVLGSASLVTLGVITFSTGTTTGNSQNQISNCDIGPAGANLPANGILSIGTSTANNSANWVSNSRIYDFFSSSLVSNGILLGAGNTGWTILGNKLYQTVTQTYTTANTHAGIRLSSGIGYFIAGNTIGYSSSGSTGVYAMTSTVATRFNAIDIGAATGSASSVQGNTITAITLTTSSSAATANGILCGINVTGGNVNVGNLSTNYVGGVSGVDLITGYPSSTGGAVVGIHSSSTGTILIQNNYIGGATATYSTAAITGGILGINISGAAGQLSIISNTVGNTTANNLRAGTIGLTTANSTFVGINLASAATGTAVISSNMIRNAASFGTGTGGTLRGVYTTGTSGSTTYSITNNTISDLTTNNANVTVSNGQLGNAGIAVTYGSNNRIANNTIFNLSNTTAATTAVNIAGISTAVSSNPTISGNTIYGISNSGTSTSATAPAMVFGIFIRGSGSDCNIHNNMISLGTGQSANTSFMGICAFGGGVAPTVTRLYYNTINISGNNSSGNQPSFGIYRGNFSTTAITFPVDIRNNLINNTRTGGTGGHYAIANNYGVTAASTTGWGLNASNNNVLNATSTTVGWWSAPLSFSAWKTASGGDANGVSGIPVTFVNAASDLHLNMGTTPTYIESGAQTISTITVDFDGQTRPGPGGSINGGALAPDIGADEFDGALVTCTVANGGVITPAAGTLCAGQIASATSLSTSAGYGSVYQWQVSTTPGGPYSNVSGGSGATTTSYTSAPLPAGVYYVVLRATCTVVSQFSVSNEVTLTVNGSPTAAASSQASVFCSGQTINFSGTSSTGTSFLWKGPGGYTSTAQNPQITNASINAHGTYSFYSAANACTSAPAILNITVNATPSTLTVSPLTSTICSGTPLSLTVTGGHVPGGVFSFTPQEFQNTTTTYPSPYSVYWGGQKMQILVLASELTAQGIVAGPITSLQFPVTSLGSSWGTTLMHAQDFQVSVGHTLLSALTSTFETGLTVVSGPMNFTPTVGFNNEHKFSPAFVWNGTDNIIIETVFSNNLQGTTNDAVISYNSSTNFNSTLIYRADNATFASVAAATSSNESISQVRPDFKLNGQMKGSYTWTPSSSLSSASGSVVAASPSQNTIYTVNVSTGLCATNGTANVNVVAMPTLVLSASNNTLCAGETVTMTVAGASTYTWYNNSNGNVVVATPATNTVYTVSNLTAPCPVVTASINISVNPTPTVVLSPSSASACAGSQVTFTATGASSYQWSNSATGSVVTIPATTNQTVTVIGQNSLTCTHSVSTTITVYALPSITVSIPTPSVCANSSVTLSASGATSYSWSTGHLTSSITVTVPPATFTVTGLSTEGCSASVAANVSVFPLPVVQLSASQTTICVGEQVVLTGSGAQTYTLSPGMSIGNSQTVSPSVSTSYTMTGMDANGCENTSSLTIEVNICTGIPDSQTEHVNVLIFPNPSTGLFTAELNFSGVKQISVTNVSGTVIMNLKTEETKQLIDLQHKARGIYFITVTSGDKQSHHKVVIE